MSGDNRILRWRLILGEGAEEALGGCPSGVWEERDSALGYLYVFLFQIHYRLFLAVFFWDGLAVFLVRQRDASEVDVAGLRHLAPGRGGAPDLPARLGVARQ